MIDLAQQSGAYEIALPYGLTVTVKPLTTAGMAAAQAAVLHGLEELTAGGTGRKPIVVVVAG